MIGANITQGPQNWQIIQQENGYADIHLEGNVCLRETDRRDNLRVVIHIYHEELRHDVINPVYIYPENNLWSADIRVPAGGNYTISSSLRWGERDSCRGDEIYHIGVGDVYIIAGQSNAWGTSKDNIEDPMNANVHMFRISGNWDIATHPLHDSTNAAINRDMYFDRAYHSPWLAFGRKIYEQTRVPIGLIPTAIGGTPLDYWNMSGDGRLMRNCLEMVRLSGSQVRGVLWYQGCNDADEANADTYLERFENVCGQFKLFFGEKIVFLTVQLNKQTYRPYERGRYFATVREAQRQAAKRINNVYVVPSLDLPVCDTIHNNAHSNLVIAQRVAGVALKYVYGKEVVCDFPDICKAEKIGKDTVRVYFDNVLDALTTDYAEVNESVFAVEDENGVSEIIEMKYRGDNTLDLVFDRAIGKNARIGCTRISALGTLPYDVATRLPILAFCDIKVD